MLFISAGMGSLLFFFGKFKKLNTPFLISAGLFFQLILTLVWSFFLAVDLSFYLINSMIAFGLIYRFKSKLSEVFNHSIRMFKNWQLTLKILYGFIFICALIQSSVSPYLPDNESYYVQTIRWLNEYGLVKGLANFHLFFSQTSGWHLLQAGFNFGFLNDFLNDINGFYLIVISFFSFNRLNHYFENKNPNDLFAGLIFIFSLFLFRFLDAPSPDLPVFLLFPVMVWVFIEGYENPEKENIILLLIFGLLLTLIKITSFPVLILAFVLILKYHDFKKLIPTVIFLSTISFTVFCIRNYIISGYLLNPTNLFGTFLNPDWQVPENLQQLYYNYTSFHAFNSPPEDYNNFFEWTFSEKFNRWFFSPKLHGLFNKLIIVLLVVFPLFIRKRKALFWVYITGLIQFLLLYYTSPQYRFFFHIILVFSLIILVRILRGIKIKSINTLMIISIFPVIFPLIYPIGFEFLTNNNFMKNQSKVFELNYLIKPHKNSQYFYEYEEITDGNLKYNSPKATYMWMTGDGELPVANKIMINFIKKAEKTKPQLRTTNLKDGFKSVKKEE